jgi:hypothetical protein
MSDTTRYTPGPYVVTREKDIDRPCRLYVRAGSRTLLASAVDDAESLAQLQLFAAAPEMVEALKRMLCHAVYNAEYNKWTIEMSDFVLQHNKELIAKAEGRQP